MLQCTVDRLHNNNIGDDGALKLTKVAIALPKMEGFGYDVRLYLILNIIYCKHIETHVQYPIVTCQLNIENH